MGYVEAFEPNLALKWCATFFYLVGCFFYVFGSFVSMVCTIARNQVKWERVQNKNGEKKRRIARLLGRLKAALPKRGKSGSRKGKGDSASPGAQPAPTPKSPLA